jgi:hypothetical protein
MNPDIVAITGDLISFRDPGQFSLLRKVLKELPHGRKATVAILGNHDYGRSWSEPQVADRVVAELSNAGITVLRNETYEVEGLQLIGMDDLWRAGSILWRLFETGGRHRRQLRFAITRTRSIAEVGESTTVGFWPAIRTEDSANRRFCSTGPAGKESSLHRGRDSAAGRPPALYQSGAGTPAAGAVQRPAGDHRIYPHLIVQRKIVKIFIKLH